MSADTEDQVELSENVSETIEKLKVSNLRPHIFNFNEC